MIERSSDQLIVDLADRHSDDLDVVLLWARRSGRLWVTVTHRRTGRTADQRNMRERARRVHASLCLRTGGGVMHPTIGEAMAAISTATAAWCGTQ